MTSREVEADIVAVTHSHSDHLVDAIAIAQNNNAPLVAIHEIATYAADDRIATVSMNIEGERSQSARLISL